MDVAYINPFLRATRSVFDVMLHVPVRLSRPALRDPRDEASRAFRISAVIGLNGPVIGQVVLSLPRRVALAMASALAGTPITHFDADCHDALAEIVNMIAGGAKKDLPGGQVSLTIPTLIPTTEVVYPASLPILVLPFDSVLGRFIVEITLNRGIPAKTRIAG